MFEYVTGYILTQLINFCFYLNIIPDFPVSNANKTWPDAFQTAFMAIFVQNTVNGRLAGASLSRGT